MITNSKKITLQFPFEGVTDFACEQRMLELTDKVAPTAEDRITLKEQIHQYVELDAVYCKVLQKIQSMISAASDVDKPMNLDVMQELYLIQKYINCSALRRELLFFAFYIYGIETEKLSKEDYEDYSEGISVNEMFNNLLEMSQRPENIEKERGIRRENQRLFLPKKHYEKEVTWIYEHVYPQSSVFDGYADADIRDLKRTEIYRVLTMCAIYQAIKEFYVAYGEVFPENDSMLKIEIISECLRLPFDRVVSYLDALDEYQQ